MIATTIIVILLGAAGVILAALLYLRVEPSVPARGILLALRAGSVVLVTLLLLGIEIPGTDPSRPASEGGSWVLVDPDLSLTLPSDGDGSLWEEVVARAVAASRQGSRLAIALPGEGGSEGIGPEVLSTRTPGAPVANLRAAVSRLGEAGADSIMILSTLRRAPEDLEALRAETPVPLRLARVGGLTRNAGVGELSLPASTSEEEDLEGRVGIFAEGGGASDSVRVEIRANGRLVGSFGVPAPSPGEEISVPFTVPASPDTGLVRYTARGFLDGDAFPPDDLRSRWVRSGRPETGVLLVSLRPDWEPRVLLPALEAVTGLEGEGYLRLGDGRFLPLVTEGERPVPVEEDEVGGRMSQAELLVVHGSADDPPSWLVQSMLEHPRVIHLPSSQAGAALAGVQVEPPLQGEWPPSATPPPSPLSPFLAGLSLGGLPPLSALLPLSGPIEATTGLSVQAGRDQNPPLPALILLESEGGRRVVTLADGFWRWGMREGEARRAYRALWGGVAGWLMAYSAVRPGEFVRPESLLQRREEPLRWEVYSPVSGLELTLARVHDGGDGPWEPESEAAEEVRYQGGLQTAQDGIATTPPVEPGVYRYTVRQPSLLPPDSVLASGLVEVERWAPSLRLPPLELASDLLPVSLGAGLDASSGGRPLRTHPLPYVVLLGLLVAEWLGRRKVGLR